MKNKFITILIILLINLSPLNLVTADEFIFEITNIEILKNGTVYKGSNRGKITTDSLTEIESNRS